MRLSAWLVAALALTLATGDAEARGRRGGRGRGQHGPVTAPLPTCPNGILNAAEECDDNNEDDGDGCDSNCTVTGCGNGVVTSGEACDDGDNDNGDGCDAFCRDETIEQNELLSDSAMVGGTTNTGHGGDWNFIDGAAKTTIFFEVKCDASANACNSTGTPLFIFRRNSSGTTRQFQIGVVSSALTVGIATAANGSILTKTSEAIFSSNVGLYRFWVYFDGTQASDEDRVYVWAYDEIAGYRALTMSDSGGAIPAALSSVSTNVLVGVTSVPVQYDWIDNVFVWGISATHATGYLVTAAERCAMMGGVWSGSVCGEGIHTGSLRDPRVDSIVSIDPNLMWTFDTDDGDSTSAVLNQIAPGTNNWTPDDGSTAFVTSSAEANRLPWYSVTDQPTNALVNVEDDTIVIRKVRLASGSKANQTDRSCAYSMQGSFQVLSNKRVRITKGCGAAHAEANQYGRDTVSFDDGFTWAFGGFVDYPFTTTVETGRSITATDVSEGNGDRGFQVYCRQTDDFGEQGDCVLTWNSIPAVSPPTRSVDGASATDGYANAPTWTVIGDYAADLSDGFVSQGSHTWAETFGGRVFASFYIATLGDTEYQVHLCYFENNESMLVPANATCQLVEDGDLTSPVSVPQEMTATMIRGGPYHGRILLCARNDGVAPGSYRNGELACTWIFDPDASPPVVYARGVGNSKWDWGTSGAWSCSNTPRIWHLSNGALVTVCRSPTGISSSWGEFCVWASSTNGSDFTQVDCLTDGVATPEAQLVNIAGLYEYEPGKVRVTGSYETLTGSTQELVWTLKPGLFDSFGNIIWSNGGRLRLNDDGATNESATLGVIHALAGSSAAAISVDFYAPDQGATATLASQTNTFLIEQTTAGAIKVTIENGGSDRVLTSADDVVDFADVNRFVLRYTGTEATLHLNGAVLTPASTSGTLPATLTAGSAAFRLGRSSADTQPCTACFFDEVAIWADVAPSSAEATGWTTGARISALRASWGMALHYWPLNGSLPELSAPDSAYLDSPVYRRLLDYGKVSAKLDGLCNNCEEADVGVALP